MDVTPDFDTYPSVARDVDHQWEAPLRPLDTVGLIYPLAENVFSVSRYDKAKMARLKLMMQGCKWTGGATPDEVCSNDLFRVLRFTKDSKGHHGREFVLDDKQRKELVSIMGIDRNDIGLIGQLHSRFEDDRLSKLVDHAGNASEAWGYSVTHAHAPPLIKTVFVPIV